MDKKCFRTTAAALCIALASGCASTTDVTRVDGAMTGARQGAALALGLGVSVMGDEEDKDGFGRGVALALITLPVFALVGTVTGALSVRK